jgi:hypothetical protein
VTPRAPRRGAGRRTCCSTWGTSTGARR